MDTSPFYQHLAGLTKEFERLTQEKEELARFFDDATAAASHVVPAGRPRENSVEVLDREAAQVLLPKDGWEDASAARQTTNASQKGEERLSSKSKAPAQQVPNNLKNMAFELEVAIWRATGLREADLVPGMSSDPYCVCQVKGKGKSIFKTPTVTNDLKPVWNVSAKIKDFHYGDALSFAVMDKDFGKSDDPLGEAILPSEKILPNDVFDEWLVLGGRGAKGVVSSEDDISSIRVTVKVLRRFPQEQVEFEEPVVEKASRLNRETTRRTALHAGDDEQGSKHEEEEEEEEDMIQDSQTFVPDPPKSRYERLQAFLLSEKFELSLAGLLCLNICSMAAELQYDGLEIGYLLEYGRYQTSVTSRFAWGNVFLAVVDQIFTVVFTIDVVVRISVLKCLFWRGGVSNYIDLFVVISSWVVLAVADSFPVKPMILRLIRFGKLARALKLVRLSQSLESLAFLMSCLRASGTVLIWTMSLLACIQCIAAIFVSNMLHFYLTDADMDDQSKRAVFRYYGTFSASFLTMYEILFANWAPACRVLTDNVSEFWSIFFILYRCIVGFAVLNVVNAVFVQSTLKVAHADEELQFEAKQKAQRNLMEKLRNMFLALDTSGDGLLSWEEFNEMFSSPKMAFWMSQLELEVTDLKSLFSLLDGGDGVISVNEFMEGATRLRGPAKSIDMAKLLMMCGKTERETKAIARAMKIEEGDDLRSTLWRGNSNAAAVEEAQLYDVPLVAA